MEGNKKCSNKKHQEANAIKYCSECNLYLCEKCLNNHEELLENHITYDLDKNNKNIFNTVCKEPNHKETLEYFCKTHNKLCCSACLSKIKGKGNGQHFNCEVCLLEEIKDEKKNKLIENVHNLENFSKNVDTLVKELKEIFKTINKNKEQISSKIKSIFDKIRDLINKREEEIIGELNNKYNMLYFNEEIINLGEKLPEEFKSNIENGKQLIKEWDDKDNDNNKLINKISSCLNIENTLNTFKEIKENIEKSKHENINIKFIPDKDEQINEFLEKIKNFGDIYCDLKFSFKFQPGNNYNVTKNGLLATKNSGGNDWNCVIMGDKEIPRDILSRWKIKINSEVSNVYSDFYIGIGPSNFTNKYYNECWSLFSNNSSIYFSKKGENSEYINEKLRKNDIVEVIVDRKKGNLSFALNDHIYKIDCSNIPKEEVLYPNIILFQQDGIVEIL